MADSTGARFELAPIPSPLDLMEKIGACRLPAEQARDGFDDGLQARFAVFDVEERSGARSFERQQEGVGDVIGFEAGEPRNWIDYRVS